LRRLDVAPLSVGRKKFCQSRAAKNKARKNGNPRRLKGCNPLKIRAAKNHAGLNLHRKKF
jgi:hypothetical protein